MIISAAFFVLTVVAPCAAEDATLPPLVLNLADEDTDVRIVHSHADDRAAIASAMSSCLYSDAWVGERRIHRDVSFGPTGRVSKEFQRFLARSSL